MDIKSHLWRLRTLRRKVFEYFGSRRFSKPNKSAIQEFLVSRFKTPGFYIEAGALDGFFESNTYYLERFCGWSGILVEPVPEFYSRLKTNRPNANTFHCALVSNEFEDPTVSLNANHAYSSVISGEGLDDSKLKNVIQVPARTLTSVVDEVGPKQIDFFSLDVEGFELEVLKGLDLSRCKPQCMIIECLTAEKKGEVDEFLYGMYECTESLTGRDFVYELSTSS